jgi:hypothetical protein
LARANPLTGAPVRVRQPAHGAALFSECLQASVRKGVANCPRAFAGVDIGFEEVPGNLTNWWAGQVPLAAASSAEAGRNATVILFRRPLEHRAASAAELRRLVHRTLMEQLAALTGIPLEELDPGATPEEWN